MSLYPYTETHDFTRLRKRKEKEEEDRGIVIYVEETKLTSVCSDTMQKGYLALSVPHQL